jgi:hypothetical protein
MIVQRLAIVKNNNTPDRDVYLTLVLFDLKGDEINFREKRRQK